MLLKNEIEVTLEITNFTSSIKYYFSLEIFNLI